VVTDESEVTLALVDVFGLPDLADAQAGECVGVVRGLVAAFGVAEPWDEGTVVDDDPAVRREHHVRQTRLRRYEVHVVAETGQLVDQTSPLTQRACGVDGAFGVHPRVDPVADGEVGRWAHEVGPRRAAEPERLRGGCGDGFVGHGTCG
jgi:hypothetical protein